MKTLAVALALAPLAIAPAFADDQVEDLDSKKGAKAKARKQEQVREVVRGLYVKSNVGLNMFFGQRAGILEPGTALSLSLGMDFLDKERSSAAFEVFFHQSLNNGRRYDDQDPAAGPNVLIQGDIHTYTGGLALEYSIYPGRRLGIGARVGGGVGFAPLLMNKEYYETKVVADEWGGQLPGVHRGVLPYVLVGPTFEYYTKLSHFSFGIDASFVMYVGLDLGADITGFLKYTF